MDRKQLKTSRVLLHNVKITKKAVGVLFRDAFCMENPVFGKIGKKPPTNATGR